MSEELTPRKKLWLTIAAAAAAVPVIYSEERGVGPAPWLDRLQAQVFGGTYWPELTLLLLVGAEIAALGAIGLFVKALTGRTLVQIFSRDGARP